MVTDRTERQERFARLYAKGGWSGLGSGPGSEVRQAGPFLKALATLVRTFEPRSILDVGCGQGLALHALSDFTGDYVGIDLVPELIEENRQRFPAANVDFRVFDLVDGRGEQRFDLVVIKDVLQHLSRASAQALMANTARMSAMVFLVNDSSCGKGTEAKDIEDGAYRPLVDVEDLAATFGNLEHWGDYLVHSGGNVPDVKSMFLLRA